MAIEKRAFSPDYSTPYIIKKYEKLKTRRSHLKPPPNH